MARAEVRDGTERWGVHRRRATPVEDVATAAAIPSAWPDANLLRPPATLDLVLQAIAAPVLVVSNTGEILRGNAIARATGAAEVRAVRRWLAGVFVGRAKPSTGAIASEWELIPIGSGGETVGYLAVRRTPPAKEALGEAFTAAVRRWKLTARQAQVLELVARGLTNELIAESLGVGRGTVEFHLSAVFDKAGVSNRATLIVRVLEAGRR
jgi:DNA-binding CsgD family transcriptional regulator